MKWGFGWEFGPFETWDAMGLKQSVSRMQNEGFKIPDWVTTMLEKGFESFYNKSNNQHNYYTPKSNKYLENKIKTENINITILKENKTNIVQSNFATSLVDMGDGVLGLEFHTKMNSIDTDIIKDTNHAIDLCENGKFDSLVLTNNGENFSAGANILMIYMAGTTKTVG